MKFSITIDHLRCAHWQMDIGSVNGFSREAVDAFDDLLSECESKFPNDLRALSIESAKISPHGHPVFCAGADQKERKNWSADEILNHVRHQREIVHRMRRMPYWIVCAVDGLALGLGTEICLAADFVIASQNAEFGFPEKSLGIIPGCGGTAWASHWAEQPEYAQMLIQSGAHFDGEHAKYLGIADACCESEDLGDTVSALAFQLLGMTPDEQRERKLARLRKIDFESYFKEEQDKYEAALRQRNS